MLIGQASFRPDWRKSLSPNIEAQPRFRFVGRRRPIVFREDYLRISHGCSACRLVMAVYAKNTKESPEPLAGKIVLAEDI